MREVAGAVAIPHSAFAKMGEPFNPAELTHMALTAGAADFAVNELKRGNL